MINEAKCIEIILTSYPEFQNGLWKEYLEDWGDDTPGFWNNISTFSHFAIELLKKDSSLVPGIFQLAEELLESGNDNVQNAICTCFLENIINATPEEVAPKKFVPFLGKKSKEYCKWWDEFTGVKTDGLWD